MKYFLVGYYGFGNCGDLASLYKVQKLIQSVDESAEFRCLHASQSSNQSLVYRWSFLAIVNSVFWSNKVVFGGGSILQNSSSKLSLYYYLSLIILTRLCGKKVLLMSQGFGPIFGWFSRVIVRVVLRLVSQISVRDNYSFSLFKLSTKRHLILASDITFFNEKYVFKNDIDQLHIGLALKPDWVESSLLQRLYHVIQKQSEKLIYYAFFPSQDMAVYNQLGVVGSHVHVVQNLFYKDQLPKVKLMIVMRYHAAVWCALNGIPFIALSKDPKLDSISKSLGQERFLCYDSVDVASFNTLFNEVLLRLDHYTDIVVDKAKELIKQSEKHQEMLYEKN